MSIKVTAQQARRLSAYLSSDWCPPGTLTYTGLKGFLFALASGPAWVHMDEWLPLIFGGRKPRFENADKAKELLLILQQLWDQVREQVLTHTVRLPVNCKLLPHWEDNFQHDAPLHQWCTGFLYGHMGLIDWWEDYAAGDEELQETLGSSVIILGFYSDEEESRDLVKMSFSEDMDFPELASSMRSYMIRAMRTYSEIGQQLYQHNSEDQDMRRMRREISHYVEAGSNILPFPVSNPDNDKKWQARQLIFAAWDSENSEDKLDLAEQALELDAECIDAYLILAGAAKKNRKQALTYLESAVNIGQQMLDAEMAEELECLWSYPDTRPYLRAKSSLAELLWDLGQKHEALAHYAELLQMNPDDNQGIRYILLTHYLTLGEYQKAEDLLLQFDDSGAYWRYSKALLGYISQGDCATSRLLRKQARQSNAEVVDYLLSEKHLPKQLPDSYSHGSDEEAVIYVWSNRKVWRAVEGALDWLGAAS